MYQSCIDFDLEFYICMLNSQIILPLFVNHQQRGKQSKQNKIFSPFFVRNKESTEGLVKTMFSPFLSKTKTKTK